MTVMSRAEARREKHYDSVRHLIPDWRSLAEACLEDTLIEAELEALGLEDHHDIAAHVESEVLDRIDDARTAVPHDAQHFVDDEYDAADHEVFDWVMVELEEGEWEVPR